MIEIGRYAQIQSKLSLKTTSEIEQVVRTRGGRLRRMSSRKRPHGKTIEDG